MGSRPYLLAFCLFVCFISVEAMAQVEQPARLRIQQLNKEAMEQFDLLEFDKAKGLLEEALDVAKEAELQRDAVHVETNTNLGILHGAGYNDRLMAVKYFTEALRIDARAVLSPLRATPTLQEMWTEAKGNLPEAPKADLSLSHTPLDDVGAGQAITIEAQAGADLNPDVVVLHYWVQGEGQINKVPMELVEPNRYRGVIPQTYVVARRSIYYYIDARDETGKRIQGHGSRNSPNIISVGGGDEPPGGAVGGGEKPKSRKKTISIGVMAGAGFGIVYGGESENVHPIKTASGIAYQHLSIEPGGAIAPFHIAPEIAYVINDKWHVGVLARLQVVNALTQVEGIASRVSILGVARAKRLFFDGPFRLYLAFGAGGGQLRHRISLGNYDLDSKGNDPTPDENERVDARVGQYVAFNLGGGLRYMFNTYVGWVLDLSGLILVPDFSANLDVNTGLLLEF